MSSLTLESIESPDFIGELLREQQSLTAVEQFSLHHELGTLTASRVPAQAKFYRGLLPATPPAAGQQYAFEVDLGACSGCKSCVAACHNLNGLEDEESWRRVGLLTSHDSDWPVVQHVTSACHHCVEPGCLSGCPVQAYEKDPLTGIVRHLDDQCFGCKYCTMMCPYEVPQYSKRLGIVRKCDMCSQRLAVGEAPACVQACPNQAIRISIVDQLSIVNETFGVGQPLLHTAPPPELTKPTTRYVSATKPQLMPADLTRDLAEESHLPLVIMLTLSQMSVGMLVMATLAVWFDGSKSSSLIATVVVGCFLGLIGIHAALLHLGRPSLAYRAFLGWRTSWLSREAIVFGVFMGLIVPTSASMLLQADTFGFLSKDLTQFLALASTSLLTIASLVGLIGVFASAKIYIVTGRTLWNAARTNVQFFGSVVALGLGGWFACSHWFSSTTSTFWGWISIAMVVLGGSPLIQCYLSNNRQSIMWNDFKSRSGRLLREQLVEGVNVYIGSILMMSGCLLSMRLIDPANVGYKVVVLSYLFAILVNQLAARYLYFCSVIKHRMPGGTH